MPTWLILATATSFIYSAINVIDKGILDHHLKGGGAEAMLVFSCIFAMFGIPYAVYMEPGVLNIGIENAGIMLTVALLNTVLLYCYLKAMEDDEAWKVVFFYQLVPVFTAVIGYFVLGETITTIEVAAMALIIIGTSIAGVDQGEGKMFSVKWRTVVLMLVATICWATEMVIGKKVILAESVYHSIFWESAFMVVVGICLLVLSRKSREGFASALKINSKWIIGLMLVGEVLYATANSISAHASEIKEVAMVMLTQPLQALFAFAIVLVLSLIFPKNYGKVTPFRMIQVAIAAPIAFAGTYLLL